MEQQIGHYRIVSELGRGGMGVVYKAHEESLNRYVAIKVLGSHLAEDDSYLQRFVREAQSAARLSHPNIVQIYAISEHAGQHYFVMEYVPGTSLQQLLKTKGAMDTVQAERIVLQAASGLQAAHEVGIIHRDIKPANLMIDERGLVKITDFGLALALGGATRLTATGMMMGTPGYLSPEQCRDEGIDHRTDIYSLGVSFYEMLTGKMPFTASSPLALIRQIMEIEPPDVRELNPAIADTTRDILQRMMAKDRDQRFASCGELIARVQQDLAALGAGAVEPSTAFVAVTPPPRPSVVAADESAGINVQPTVVVDSGEKRTPASTSPVRPETVPSDQPVALTEPPPPGRRRTALLAVLAIAVVGAGALAAGTFVVWKLDLRDRLASLRRVASERREQPRQLEEGPLPTEVADAGRSERVSTPAAEAATVGQPSVPPAGRDVASEERPAPLPTTGGRAEPSLQPADQGVAAPVDRPQRRLPPPTAAPPPRGVAVVTVGETLLAGAADAFVQDALVRAGATLVDESSLPAVADLFSGDQPPPRGALREALEPHARHVILIRAEYLGERPLAYMGRYDTAFQARLTAAAIEVATGQVVGPPLSRQVEYTHLTVERVAAETLRPWLALVRASVTDR